LSSVSWIRGIPLLEAYASAKAAIVGFTNTLARALGPHRIRVNAIAPPCSPSASASYGFRPRRRSRRHARRNAYPT